MNVGWRERNQQDATNLMFSIKLLCQHVSGIIMPIIRRTRLCTAAYAVLHWLWWLWLCGAGTRAVCTVKVTSNAEYNMFRGSVKGTGYPLHSPVSPSLRLPCVTVCHHISAVVYGNGAPFPLAVCRSPFRIKSSKSNIIRVLFCILTHKTSL